MVNRVFKLWFYRNKAVLQNNGDMVCIHCVWEERSWERKQQVDKCWGCDLVRKGTRQLYRLFQL